MKVLETERLRLRHGNLADAPFIYQLLTDPSFIDNIADKGVTELEHARNYIRDVLMASYEKNGFGLFVVEVKDSGIAAGICGLVKRDNLDTPDVGYAFLPAHTGKGYATEAAKAVLNWGNINLGLAKIVGITKPTNQHSIRVLEKIGLRLDGEFSYEGTENLLFVPAD